MKTQLEALKTVRESLVDTEYVATCTQFIEKLNGFIKFWFHTNHTTSYIWDSYFYGPAQATLAHQQNVYI